MTGVIRETVLAAMTGVCERAAAKALDCELNSRELSYWQGVIDGAEQLASVLNGDPPEGL